MFIAQQLINGVTIGLGYVLVTLGFNIVFGVLRIVNLAYGEIFTIASYAFVLVWAASGSASLAIAASLSVATILSLVVHIAAVQPLGDVSALDSPEHIAVLVSTIGVSLILRNGVLALFGAQPRAVPTLAGNRAWTIGTLLVPLNVVLAAGIALALVVAVHILLVRSEFGLRLRAIADNKELARLSGVPVTLITYASVAISGVLCAVAALMVCDVYGATSPLVGVSYALKALIAVICGGLGNVRRGTAIALGLGIGEAMTAGLISAAYRDVIVLGLLVIFIVSRGALSQVLARRTLA